MPILQHFVHKFLYLSADLLVNPVWDSIIHFLYIYTNVPGFSSTEDPTLYNLIINQSINQ